MPDDTKDDKPITIEDRIQSVVKENGSLVTHLAYATLMLDICAEHMSFLTPALDEEDEEETNTIIENVMETIETFKKVLP